jgi:hypothetical protein
MPYRIRRKGVHRLRTPAMLLAVAILSIGASDAGKAEDGLKNCKPKQIEYCREKSARECRGLHSTESARKDCQVYLGNKCRRIKFQCA